MASLEEVIKARYPLKPARPDDPNLVRVAISDDYYLGAVFYDLRRDPNMKAAAGKVVEVPADIVDRWHEIAEDYGDLQDELASYLRG